MRRFVLVIVILNLALRAVGQINPPSGANYFDFYRSPMNLGSYPSVTTAYGPSSQRINPSFDATLLLPMFGVQYVGLVGAGTATDEQGYKGHVLSLGALLPNSLGVLGITLQAYRSTLSQAAFGTGIEIGATFAKDVLQDLSVGGSLRFAFAGYESESIYADIKQEDWALLGDVGFIHRIEESNLSNLRWGVVLSDFGKGLGSGDGYDYADGDETISVTPYPAPFTLSSGISASLIDAERFRWDVSIDLSFPSFQNVELGVATRFEIADFVTLGLGTSYNLRELIPNLGIDARSLFPGVSLVLNFDSIQAGESQDATGGPTGRVRIAPAAAFAPMSGQTYAFGLGSTILVGTPDATPPVIEIGYPGPEVHSPLNEDFGISYPISIRDDRYITRYEFRIDLSSGETVWEQSGTHPRFAGDDGTVVSQAIRGFAHQYRSLELPSEIVWDGAVAAAGSNAAGSAPPDGDYLLYVEAEDDGGNVATAGPFAFSVDGSSPIATVELPELGARIFSPNNDGNKETLTIRQEGSIESLWEGEILRGNSVVRRVTWIDEAPSDLEWDGTGDSGSVLTDGTYRYRLSSTDEAGNRSVITSDTFVLNTQSTPITVGIDRGTFSPNRDGRNDELTFSLGISVQAGIVEWRSEIVDAAGATVRDYLSRSAIPRVVAYDGRDDSGEFLADGIYYARLSILYENGNNPAEISPSFEVDVTPPEAAVTADLALFSPNGDGNKDFISFFQDTSAEDLWIGEITTGGAVILRSTWRGTADQKFVWDGHAENGLRASNGNHQYQLISTDRAGNVGRSTLVEFEVNYEDTAVGLTRSLDAFSPNADGSLDEQLFTISLDVREGVESYQFSVYSSDETPVRRLSERAVPDSTIEWQGVTDTGGRVGDGTYYAEISILYANGNRPKARTRPFVVDTTTPTIRIEADTDLFSPNQDGSLDSVTFRSDSSPESLWEGVIRSSAGAEIRRIFWPGITSSYVWNGTDEAGNLVPDGVYYFEIATVDEAGNSASARTEDVRLDTRLTSIYISVDPARFSPNRDGEGDTVIVSMSTAIRDGVSGWSVEIRKKDGALTRRYSGDRIAEQIVWDGRDRFGRVVEGEYTAQYIVTYEKGDTPSVLSSSFYLDVSSPELTIVTAPSPFSPDEDGVDDAVVISVNASDVSGFDSWNLVITDPTGVPFRTLSGAGRPPRSIEWDGSGDDGELVLGAEEYRFTMNVSDTLGNRTRATGVIPVDVLLFRFGTGFRMSISNIIFRPNSPLLESEDSDSVDNNEWVLERIAEMVNKYRSYDLRIEGHAVSLRWEDPEMYEVEQRDELLPLSQARAETVATALKERGVAGDRITSIGLGGSRPIVPHEDEIHRWKNRRMEFILLE